MVDNVESHGVMTPVSQRVVSLVQTDFDQIALLSQSGWDHSRHYHSFLLKHIAVRCEAALDIGCGTGTFTRLLAKRSNRVVALDLSPRMIEVAKARSKHNSNIEFQVADATRWAFPVEEFDCVVSIATLHHLPIEDTLLKMRETLKVGGTLAVLDLYESAGLGDLLTGIVAMPVSFAMRLIKIGRLIEPRPVRDAWTAHGRNDIYPTLRWIRQVCGRILPGAQVRKHLLWRYSIIWRKAI
jgi:ubiquinone/menaquinone biosynthesis C-methylase UbiE